MEIEFDQTAEDIVAFRRYYTHRRPGSRRERAIILAQVILSGLIIFALLAHEFDWSISPRHSVQLLVIMVPFFLITFGGIVGYILWSNSTDGIRWRVGREIRRGTIGKLALGRRRLAIDQDGYRVTGDGFEFSLAWRNVPRVVTDLDHLYLCQVYRRKSMIADIVPRWAFPTEFAFVEFGRLAEDYWQSAHPGT